MLRDARSPRGLRNPEKTTRALSCPSAVCRRNRGRRVPEDTSEGTEPDVLRVGRPVAGSLPLHRVFGRSWPPKRAKRVGPPVGPPPPGWPSYQRRDCQKEDREQELPRSAHACPPPPGPWAAAASPFPSAPMLFQLLFPLPVRFSASASRTLKWEMGIFSEAPVFR